MSTIEKALNSLEKKSKEESEARHPGTVERAETAQVTAPEQALATPAPKPEQPAEVDPGACVSIPFDVLHRRGFLTPGMPRSIIAEEFRAIKRPLLHNIVGKTASPIANANLIMVTSALEGDGKTFSSLNLAMSIAMEQDKTVLFVDADVLKSIGGESAGHS